MGGDTKVVHDLERLTTCVSALTERVQSLEDVRQPQIGDAGHAGLMGLPRHNFGGLENLDGSIAELEQSLLGHGTMPTMHTAAHGLGPTVPVHSPAHGTAFTPICALHPPLHTHLHPHLHAHLRQAQGAKVLFAAEHSRLRPPRARVDPVLQ